jgi:hypothetical protein
VINEMVDPGDGRTTGRQLDEAHYAGDGLWSYEEDMYNPNDFGEMIKGWLTAKKAAAQNF